MMKQSKNPSFNKELEFLSRNILVFGMDEVGRGSFAGPIVAAGVCFKKEYVWFNEINDSKLLTHRKRKYLSKLILKNAICFIELIDVEVINEFGIGEANRLIFENLVRNIQKELKVKRLHFLIDGRKQMLNFENIEFIVKGDRKSISIAAASIIAKVYRDELMKKLGGKYKGYDFSKNKGYGTKGHQNALRNLGLSEIHRTSFKLQKFLG